MTIVEPDGLTECTFITTVAIKSRRIDVLFKKRKKKRERNK